MHATDIVAYTYQAETLCPTCTMDAVAVTHKVNHPCSSSQTEGWLTFMSECLGINRYDEREFDSSEFPKVVFADQVEAHEEWTPGADDIDGYRWVSERCDGCGEELI